MKYTNCRVGIQISTHKTINIGIREDSLKAAYKEEYESIRETYPEYSEEDIIVTLIEDLIEDGSIELELDKEAHIEVLGEDREGYTIGYSKPVSVYPWSYNRIEEVRVSKGSWKDN